jgi:apolipoprotein N-acyltransferase
MKRLVPLTAKSSTEALKTSIKQAEFKISMNLKKIILSIITGLLAVCAFPKINLFFLAWLAFIPLIFVISRSGLKSSFFYGLISGFVFNAMGLYWLVPTLKFNIGSYLQTVMAACSLWMYLALYWGIWSLYLSFSRKTLKDYLHSNALIILFGSCMWVLLEYIKTYFLTGFPWMLIGYSQYKFTEIIQIAEFTGIYGVSFLVIFCNLCFYFWISTQKGNKYLYTAMALIVTVSIFGAARAYKFRFFGDQEFTVSIVQPNVDQNKKWNQFYKDDILSNLKEYAFKIAENKTDLVIWPETVFPGSIPEDEQLYDIIKCIVKVAGGFNIVGSVYNDKDYGYFNAALAFDERDSDYKAIHKKNHLLPFGEYIPFRSLFSRFFGVLNQIGDSNKGQDTDVFDNGKIYVGAIICSENFFPDISRNFVLSGAKVLTNHTNDAWFFDTAAPHQHFIMNIFRAVENRKAVVVSANSGISGIIEASGVITEKTASSESMLLTGKFLQNDFKTFYTKHGDLFVNICAGLLLTLILLELCVRIRKV